MVAGRTGQNSYLYLDSQKKAETSSSGPSSSLDVFTPLYLGGVPDFSNLPGQLSAYFYQGFDGLIADASIRTELDTFTPLLTLTNGQTTEDMVGIPVEEGRNIVNKGKGFCDESTNVCANGGKCKNTGT